LPPDTPRAADDALLARTTCTALVITCSDFRFKSAERRFIESAGLTDDYDLIARPGGIRSLVLPRDAAAGESMNDEIRLLWGLHRFNRIIALNHLSCRAYDDIAIQQNERAIHVAHLEQAGALLDTRFAGVRAQLYLADTVGGRIAVVPVQDERSPR
jgi:hypothetical protein